VHNRCVVRLPVGSNRYTKVLKALEERQFSLVVPTLQQTAVQPLLVRDPPLMRFLLYGCDGDCPRCAKNALTEKNFRVFMIPEVIRFLMGVYTTEAALKRDKDNRIGSFRFIGPKCRAAMDTLAGFSQHVVASDGFRAKGDGQWDAFAVSCSTTATAEQREAAYPTLLAWMESVCATATHDYSYAYSVNMLNMMEQLLWKDIVARHTSDPKEAAALERLLVLTTHEHVVPLAAHIPMEPIVIEWANDARAAVWKIRASRKQKFAYEAFPGVSPFPNELVERLTKDASNNFTAPIVQIMMYEGLYYQWLAAQIFRLKAERRAAQKAAATPVEGAAHAAAAV